MKVARKIKTKRGKMFRQKAADEYKQNTPYQLVKIYWWDHWRSGASWNASTDPKLDLCLDVGWIFKEDKEGYLLNRSWALPFKNDSINNCSVGHTAYILKNTIHKLEYL